MDRIGEPTMTPDEEYVVTEALHMEHGDRYQFTVRSL